jgi:alkylation response protein AidB-like acyl-CoA dehydrogenase
LDTSGDVRKQIISLVRDFVKNEVTPVASKLDNDDEYPHELVDIMKELGLFGITIPEKYGGLGLDHTTFATIFEELSKGWMSLTGMIGTHHILANIIGSHGSNEQKQRFLPKMVTGEIRGGLALTEPGAGSDVQNITASAIKDGDKYIVNGSKMFITNGLYGNAFAVAVKTDLDANPKYKGISCMVIEKGSPGFSVAQKLDKLGYRGVDTCELVFDNCEVPVDNLIGGKEGRGFSQVLGALEAGRVNIAARAVGVATAAFESAIEYSQKRESFGVPISSHQSIQIKLADMATKIQAARLLTYDVASKMDSGDRVDLEAGMAKLFASEVCGEVAMEAMRIHGGYGYIKDFDVERHYRDAPLMIIGEGTNEIQKLIIARRLLEKYSI